MEPLGVVADGSADAVQGEERDEILEPAFGEETAPASELVGCDPAGELEQEIAADAVLLEDVRGQVLFDPSEAT